MQESVLLTGSVRENIELGRAGIGDEEMVRVAQISGTHQFMGQIANGYDLRLADRGEGLSRRPAPVDRHRPRARRPAADHGDGRAVERDGRADRRRADPAPAARN